MKFFTFVGLRTMSTVKNSPAFSIWNANFQKHHDYILEIVNGILNAPKRDFLSGISRLLKQREFHEFCREIDENLIEVLKRYAQNEDSKVLVIDFFGSSSILERQIMDPEVAFRALLKIYTQYLGVRILSESPFKADPVEFKSLVETISDLPSTSRFVERRATEDVLKSLQEDSEYIYTTKFRELNYILGRGLRSRRLYTIGGAPGVGKSMILLNFFIDAALGGVPVTYLTLENTIEETQRRIVANILEYDLRRLYFDDPDVRDEVSEKMSSEEYSKTFAKLDRFGTLIEVKNPSLNEILSILNERKPKLYIIDYLNLISYSPYKNVTKDLEELTLTLENASKWNNCAIVTACQLNRQACAAKDPDETTVGESFGIVKASSLFATFYREKADEEVDDEVQDDEECDPREKMVLNIVKSRFTPLHKIYLRGRKEYARIEER